MKNFAKLFGFIAMVAIITFSIIACKSGSDDGDDNDGKGDPSKWTAVTDSTFGSSSINGIAYGGGVWAAVGNIKIAHSQNGTSWTAATDSTFTGDSYINGIAYGSNKFVAVGDYGKMAYSANGITWTSVSANTFDSRKAINGIAHNGLSGSNGRFVAVGDVRGNPDNTSTGLGQIAYSPDGTSWTAVTDIKIDNHINGIAYGGGMWIAVGNNGKMAYSSDGEAWTAVTDSKFGTSRIIRIAYGGGKFVAVGVNGKMAYSANGITWTAVTYNIASDTTYNTINDIAYGNNRWVAVGEQGRMAYSTDGITWTKVAEADNPFAYLVSAGGIAGETGTDINAVAYGGGKFIAAAKAGKMAYCDW